MRPPQPLRSGNGPVGSPDGAITMLVGPSAGGFPEPFTPEDFAAARSGPSAHVVEPLYNWHYPLSGNPDASWISTQAEGSDDGATALFAIDFDFVHDGMQRGAEYLSDTQRFISRARR